MSTTAPDSMRFPIGKFARLDSYTDADRAEAIARITAQPAALAAAISGLSEAEYDTPYRDGGWTVRQVVHHVADSHMNALIRLKLALTEEEPTITPYDQDAWVRLADVRDVSPLVSVALLAATHERMTAILRAMKPEEFSRAFMHPENGRMTIDHLLGMYAWHGDHHVAHIVGMRERAKA